VVSLSRGDANQEMMKMRYMGVVIQQLWSEEPGRRERDRRRRKSSDEVPGSVRRRTAPRRPELD
jgi:hypothetical protein